MLTTLVPLPVVLPLLAAGLNLALTGKARAQTIVTTATLSLVLLINVVLLLGVDAQGTQVVAVGGWALPYGIALVVDRLSALMLVVASIVTLCVFVYAVAQDMGDSTKRSPVSVFNPAYLILCAGVFDAFVAGDLFNLYVGFEMLLAASYVLLTLESTATRIRAGATYIVISLVSSLIFLTAIAVIFAACGTVNMAQLAVRLDGLPDDVQMILHVMLLLGFGIKAAVFPLSFWLPDSYPTAPAPVTAVFAGLLTKVGIYAIIRTETILFADSSLRTVLLVVAALTMVIGILGAIAQSEIKRMLSFTLISHIGYMLFGVALGTVAGMTAAVYYTVHHIVVQAALFLAVGMVEQRTATTSVRRLGGLAVLSPVISMLFLVPALNLAGIPPFSGFIGKVGLFKSGFVAGDPWAILLVVAGTVTSLLTLYVIGKTWNRAFWREPDQVEEPTESLVLAQKERRTALAEGRTYKAEEGVPRLMLAATTAMVLVSLVLTVAARPLWDISERAAEDLQAPATYVTAVLGPEAAAKLAADPDAEGLK